jgi:hypothetical protein
VRPKWPRSQPVLLMITTLGVVILSLVVYHYTRESPDYSQIEDGLWLGGFVKQPPPGTAAILNLCELDDPFRVEFHRWESIRDAEPVPSLDWLRAQVEFIDAKRKAGRTVFVHCRNGVSRSAMVMAAYQTTHSPAICFRVSWSGSGDFRAPFSFGGQLWGRGGAKGRCQIKGALGTGVDKRKSLWSLFLP